MKSKLLLILMFISYTLSSQIIYVDQNTSGSNNGSDWENAYTNLQMAISNIGSNTTINVAEGTYLTTTTTDRTISFNIPSGVKIYGGFPTGGGIKDTDSYPTILTGDIGIPGDNTDNSYHVVFFHNTISSTEIDGFIIEKGYANGSGSNESNGGGILISTVDVGDSNAYIRNCIVRNNYAVGDGGGIFVSKRAEIYNCKIYSNQVENSGGGISISTNGRIYNSYIVNNKSVNFGGGIKITGFNSAPKAINCVIANNESGNGSGAYLTTGSLNNCTIVNNKGNGIYFGSYGNSYNGIIWGNTTYQSNHVASNTSHLVENNCIQDISSTGTNIRISSANNSAVFGENYPRFTKPTTFTGNSTSQEQLDEILNANWYINPQSAAIDFGDNSSYPTATGTPTVGINGNNRTINTVMDAGAYEALTNLITTQALNQTPTSAILNGEILFAETINTITRGFVYAITPNFEVTTATSVTNSGNGLGIYSNNITSLTEDKFYYYKTWVQFDGIKYYGNEIKFNTTNLVAYYPFNGNANDESGNNHHGTVIGPTLTEDRFGDANSAYYYNGANNNIDIGDWENGGPMSFNLWVRWDAFNNWGLIMDLAIGRDNNNIYIGNQSTNNIFMFHTLDGGTKYLFYCDDTTTYPNSPLTLNSWTMITCTVDETGLMKAFKNAELIGTFNGFTPTKMVRTNQYFGSANYPENGYFNGALDDIRIYNSVLSEAEILNLYNLNTLNIEKFDNTTFSNLYISENILYFKNSQNLNKIKSIEIFNLMGQKVFETKILSNKISLNTLTNGIYILKIKHNNNHYSTLKFIIN